MKNLKWKDIFQKCNHNKYCQIITVNRKYTLKSNLKNLINNYGVVLVIAFLIMLALLIYTFRTNLMIVVYSAILCFFLFLMTVFSSTYKITLEEDKLLTRLNMQDDTIPYDKLNNIYLEKKKIKIFFIPIYTYTLKVTYFIDEERINILSFPIIMLNKKDIINFFKSFEVKAYKDQDEEIEKENRDRKNFHKAIAIVAGIVLIIIFVIALILSLIKV